MSKIIDTWDGTILLNGSKIAQIDTISSFSKGSVITLLPKETTHRDKISVTESNSVKTYVVTVKNYMTKKSTPEFDFMAKWNKDIPMPLRTMVGNIVKETPGMVYMTLHGDIYTDIIPCCMKCGRPLTNPVSQFFGIGPECGGHNYVNPFNTEEELKEAVAKYKNQLNELVWEGWIIRSAITEMKEI